MECKARIVKAYAVMSNHDLTEGRGREFIASICDRLSVATSEAKGQYVMGTDAPIREIEALVFVYNGNEYAFDLNDSVQFFSTLKKERMDQKLRESALSKLTPEERKALGV